MLPLSLSELKLLGGALALAGVLCGVAWAAHHERQLGATQCRADTAAATLKATHDAQVKVDALTAQLQASDDAHTAELRKAQDETNRLRDAVAAGPVRLRVAAKCPAAVPEAAPASGVDPGPGAELDTAARPAYFALRDGIDRVTAQLGACQQELKLRAK